MKLDLSATWNDAMAMLRANLDLISAIAGLFLLLPNIALPFLVTRPAAPPAHATPAQAAAYLSQLLGDNWPVFLGGTLLSTVGTLAILSLVMDRSRPTVAEALRAGLFALPVAILANVIQSAVVVAGLFLFIVPGLYLLARLALLSPVIVVEHERNPLTVIVRSFRLTRGNGWRLLLLLGVALVVGTIVSSAASSIAGILVGLLLPRELAQLTVGVVGGTIDCALAVTLVLLVGAAWRQFAARG
jgi:hypothetical protein